MKTSIAKEVKRSIPARALPALGGLLLCLVSCRAVGPDYHGPPAAAVVNASAANGSFVSGEGAAFSREPGAGAWWRLYESVPLDGLVSEAFSANTDLRMAAANLERSRALLGETRAAREPTAEFNFDPSYQQLSPEAYLHAGPLAPLGLHDIGVSVSYELDLFGRLRRGVEAASAEDEAVRAAYELTKVIVAADTARAYADVCSAGEQLAVTQRSLMLQMQSTKITERLFQAGRAPTIDFTRSAGQVAQIKANIPIFEARRANALFRLAALTGHPPAEYPKSIELCARAPRLLRPIPIGDGTALLRRRPDVREAEREVAAATARVGIATADLYPRVALGVTAGSTGALTDLFTTPTNRYGIGLEIHWQANRSRVRARIAEASANGKLTLARFDGVVLTALRETESALTTYSRDLQRDDDLSTAGARAAEAEQQAKRLYVGGKIDFLPLLDAQRSLAGADAALAASHAQLAADQVAIFLALGGGWES
jgi:NodT family efflux transporter outer membrane factor (OMF) lipoprotein